MGGASGALYSIFFPGFVSGFQQHLKFDPNLQLSLSVFSEAPSQGLVTMRKYSPATVGDRTMIDALIPAVETLRIPTKCLRG